MRACSRPHSLALATCLITYGCANIMMPEGGPKDVPPPKIVKTSPLQGSTHFKGKVLKLVFDKEIEVKDIYSRLVITPQLKQLENKPSYTCSVWGNTVTLKLMSPLEENTTYTFNFNNAIRDTTEGNIAASPTLTFSTGDRLDDEYVAGQVTDLMTQLPAPQALVALYKARDEEAHILNATPDYFTTADEQGKFRIDHISPGQYYICAGKSHKKSYEINPETDPYGFLKAPIDLTAGSVDNISIPILQADVRRLKLQRQQPVRQYYELTFNKPIQTYTLTLQHPPQGHEEVLYSHLVEEHHTIRVYNTLELLEEDSLEAQLTATDVLGNMVEETITLHFKARQHPQHPASYKFDPTSGTAIKSHFVGTMTLNKPVKEILIDHLYFVLNGQHKVQIQTEDVTLSNHRSNNQKAVRSSTTGYPRRYIS